MKNPILVKASDELVLILDYCWMPLCITSVKEGVKTTEYPYVKPTAENMKRGGSIRGGGIEQRGKTKGRFV